jgi:hypothetical protein
LATEELTAQLAQVGKDLNDQLALYATELTTATAKAVETYNLQLKQIRDETAATIAQIDAQISALNAKIAQMRAALAALANLQAPTIVTAPYIPSTVKSADELVKDLSTTKGLTNISAGVNAAVSAGASASDTANAMMMALLKDKTAQAQLGGVAGAASTARYTGQAIQYFQQQAAQGNNITVNAQTNASPLQIAAEVGWAVRTSSDVQYRTSGSGKYGMLVD